MASYSYPVLAFRQQRGAPIQVAFVAHATDVLEWSGVPRKSDELLTGYQRFRDQERINREIVPFFQDPKNCSPTAVIVALRNDAGLGRCTLSGVGDLEPGEIKPGTLEVSVDADLDDASTVMNAALAYVNARLEHDVSLPAEVDADDPDADDAGGEDAQDDPEREDESEATPADDVTHLGTVTLAKMKALLDDKANWTNRAFVAAVADYVKPAFLIDGQHRVSAAAKIGTKGLPFMVCGLYDPAWEEQVFQFTVVNLKPKRIPPSLITSIAGLSLTNVERDHVQQRLSNAGVKLVEVEIMSLVAYDDASPFYNRVDMSVRGPKDRGSLLGYGGMKRVASVWHSARHPSLKTIARHLFAQNAAAAVQAWRAERTWFEFLCAFWSLIRDHYGSDFWLKADENHLFTNASLWALQEAVLLKADSQMQSFWRIDASVEDQDGRRHLLKEKLTEVVTSMLSLIPAGVWTTSSPNWGESDTNAGRERIRKMLEDLLEKGSSTGSVWRAWQSHAFFKG